MSARSAAALAVAVFCAVFHSYNFCLSPKLHNVICGTIGRRFYGRNLKETHKTAFRMCVEACKKNTNCNAVNYWSTGDKNCQLLQTESLRAIVGCDDCIGSFIKKECIVTTAPSNPMSYKFVLPELTAPFRLRFAVRAARDAIIALATGRNDRDIFCHITFGGWSNSKIALRTGDAPQTQHWRTIQSRDVSNLLSADEDRAFWIEYEDGMVRFGKGGETNALIEWNSTAEVGAHSGVNVAISTWQQVSGDWVFEQNCE